MGNAHTIISYVPAPLQAYAEKAWDLFRDSARHVIITGVKLATGKGELERICSARWHSEAMTKKFLKSLRLSGLPPTTLSTILRPAPFDIPSTLEHLLSSSLLVPSSSSSLFFSSLSAPSPPHQQRLIKENLGQCLAAVNYANAVVAAALALKETKYDAKNTEHEALLEKLWNHLKPDVKREGGRITEEWGEIGFQGKDPASDFRGMGLFGLHQLLYFAEHQPTLARAILLESHHPRRFFPFAATGINISSFVLTLLEERLLDEALVEECEKDFEHHESTGPPHDSPELIQKGLERLHDHYGEVYQDFHQRWITADPPNIMSFPVIYDQLKIDHRHQLRTLRGDYDLSTALLPFLS